jgi:hypothetical protein
MWLDCWNAIMPSERVSSATIAPEAAAVCAVPEAGDDRAHQRRHVGAPDAEGGARQHGVGHAGLHAGIADEIHQKEDDEGAEADRQDEVDEVPAQQEQAGGQIVAPQAVHIRRPDVEDAEGAPLALGRGCEVFVVECG